MKKKELMLDFTSLLDVILILLFIVIANMNQASAAVGEELTAQLTDSEVRIQMLALFRSLISCRKGLRHFRRNTII